MKIQKTVRFNDSNNLVLKTYSSDEYDRSTINSILKYKLQNKITNEEWIKVFITLDLYKLYDMVVHRDSISNNLYFFKNTLNLIRIKNGV